jgi:hypothetical protein
MSHVCGVVMPQQIFSFTTKEILTLLQIEFLSLSLSLSLSLFNICYLTNLLSKEAWLPCALKRREVLCSYMYICFHDRQPAENQVNGIHVFVLCVCVCVLWVVCYT